MSHRTPRDTAGVHSTDFAERVRTDQERLASLSNPQHNFIVCGAESSGSVVARRLAENPEVTVLRLEASGDGNVPSVTEAKVANQHWQRLGDHESRPRPVIRRCEGAPQKPTQKEATR
jgi:choline dehydrogenase